MVRRITAATLVLLLSCGIRPVASGRGERYADPLSYAQFHSLTAGLPAGEILDWFGQPLSTLRQGGRVVALSYRCENSSGETTELRLHFGPDERLRRWGLTRRSGA